MAGDPQPGGDTGRIAVRITPDARRRLRAGHPWIFDRSVVRAARPGSPGDLAVIFDDERRFEAIGLWDPSSPIRLRVLHRGAPTPIDRSFWRQRVGAAVERRRALLADGDTTGVRLVNGENDGLPGLVLDRYDTTMVVKLYTAAWIRHLPDLVAAIDDVAHPEALILRHARSVAPASLGDLREGDALLGTPPPGPVRFLERGLWFEADVLRGQKTGHFLDQRDNRALVGARAAGRRVLDLFASTGGFTVHAAAGGATEVVSVDLSAPTLAVAARNLAANAHLPAVAACRHRSVVGDAIDVMRDLRRRREQFDIVVVDPPSFASRAEQVPAAQRAYAALTAAAIPLVRDGGLLVQCSCTARIDERDFVRTVTATAADSGRNVSVERVTGHAADHPISFPEGRYLKCVVLRVR